MDTICCHPHCCSGCRDQARVERITQKAEIQWMEAVSDGPVPELHTDSEEEEPEEAEELIKPGDHIFAIGVENIGCRIKEQDYRDQ